MLAYFSWAVPQITIIRLLRAPDGRRLISKNRGRVCSKYWSDATHPHTLDATPLSRYATLPQVPRYGVHERSEHGGLERVHRTFRTGCVRCSCQLSPPARPGHHMPRGGSMETRPMELTKAGKKGPSAGSRVLRTGSNGLRPPSYRRLRPSTRLPVYPSSPVCTRLHPSYPSSRLPVF